MEKILAATIKIGNAGMELGISTRTYETLGGLSKNKIKANDTKKIFHSRY
jgi:hypothetical protein